MRAALEHDRLIVDKIAALLGTTAEWGGADSLIPIADLIGEVRPHPGDAWQTYRDDFRRATGRELPVDYDYTDRQ